MAEIDKLLISIIVPVYNVEEYVDECLESIVKQTYRNLEIIIVDDASPDKSGKKCDLWAKKDKRIKVIHKQKNEGLFRARITGFESMRGDYFMTVDSDDYIKADFVQTFLDRNILSGSDITISKSFMTFGEKVEQSVAMATLTYSSVNIFDEFMRALGPEKWGWSMWGKMYSAELYKSAKPYLLCIDKKINASEDLLFAVVFCYFAKKTSYVQKEYAGYYYRQTASSIMGSVSIDSLTAKLDDIAVVFSEVEKFLTSMNLASEYEQNIKSSREWHLRVNVDRIGSVYADPLRQQNTTLAQDNLKLQQDNIRLQQENVKLARQTLDLQRSMSYRLGRTIGLPYVKVKIILKRLSSR